METLIIAIQFLTTLPVRTEKLPAADQLGRAAGWFSFVGALIGFITAGMFILCRIIFPDFLAAALSLAVWIILSGGLHLDGVADCCDSLFVSAEKDRRLEIMSDPHHGTFGTIGLIVLILVKFAALYSLPVKYMLFGLPFACALSRWLLLPAGRQPNAKPGDLGESYSGGLKSRDMIWGVIPVIILAVLTGWISISTTILVVVFTILLISFTRSKLDGITGDVLGFIVELSETLVLISLCINLGLLIR
jgi:adenosylcobinamide-GDP ribazoletransferase